MFIIKYAMNNNNSFKISNFNRQITLKEKLWNNLYILCLYISYFNYLLISYCKLHLDIYQNLMSKKKIFLITMQWILIISLIIIIIMQEIINKSLIKIKIMKNILKMISFIMSFLRILKPIFWKIDMKQIIISISLIRKLIYIN